MKDYRRLFFLFALITLSFFSDIYAQEDYLLVFRNVDKATFQLPVKTPRRSENSDELRTRIMDEMDSCIIQKDTLTIYFSFNGLTVYLDTITSNFDFGTIGMTNLKRNFSLLIPSCSTVPCDSINIIVIESFLTRYTFAKRGKGRYLYIGASYIDIDLDYIKKHQFKVEYITIRS